MVACLRDGSLAAGAFVSVPELVERLGLPLAATREAVRQADANGRPRVAPKRDVRVMGASPGLIRACMDLRRRRAAACRGGGRAAARRPARRPSRADRGGRTGSDARSAAARGPGRSFAARRAFGRARRPPLALAAYQVNRDRIAIVQNDRPVPPDRIVAALREHPAILETLDQGDAKAAVAAIDLHHRATLRWWGILEP